MCGVGANHSNLKDPGWIEYNICITINSKIRACQAA